MAALTRETSGSFIDGRPVTAKVTDTIVVRRDPADETVEVSRHHLAELVNLNDAIAGARDAQAEWRRERPGMRARVLHRAASMLEEQLEDAATEITRQEGKLLAEARVEVSRAADSLRIAAELARIGLDSSTASDEPGTNLFTRHRPLGVVGLVTPWNFPLGIPVRKASTALAAGNSAVLKPSPLSLSPALRLAKTLIDAGLPPGCFNVVCGDDEIGRNLASRHDIDGISFTGSTPVGEEIITATVANGIPCQAEMGGNSPLIVTDDVDVEFAAEVAVRGAFSGAGQTCTATRRIVATPGIRPRFVDAFLARTRALTIGPGTDPSSEVAPLVSRDHRDRVLAHVERALADGSDLLYGGEALATQPDGAFMLPTILRVRGPESYAAQHEIFGPVVALLDAADLADALAIANQSRYGLSASIVTQSAQAVEAFLCEVEAGMLHVNRPTVGSDPQMPFGGMKASAYGPREQAAASFNFFAHQQTVYAHRAA